MLHFPGQDTGNLCGALAARAASLIKEAAPKTKLISEFPALRVGSELTGSGGQCQKSDVVNFRGLD